MNSKGYKKKAFMSEFFGCVAKPKEECGLQEPSSSFPICSCIWIAFLV